MSDVRTQIRNIIWNTYAAGYRDGRNGDSEDVAEFTRGRADRIIEMVREAMLSDAAVEASAKAVHSTEHLLTGAWSIDDLHESQLLNGPRTLDEEEREGYRYAARLSNKAALRAAGITQEGTGDE